MRKEEELRVYGDLALYSPGTAMIMAQRQIARGVESGKARVETAADGTTVVTWTPTGKWFIPGEEPRRTAMLGAVCGDVVGSIYEWHNISRKLRPEEMISARSRFTDDTVMTCAVAQGLQKGLSQLPADWMQHPGAREQLLTSVQEHVHRFGNRYPKAGYGGRFRAWLASEDPQPYNSWANGSAMRASYPGWAARSLEEAEKLAEISSSVTHDHPEGTKGAVVIAGCIYLLRTGADKAAVREYAARFYDLNFTLDEIRPTYKFDVSCAGSVPQAICAFLENDSFTDVIASAISIGGDSDTIAAMAGSLAEVVYPIPEELRGRVLDRLDGFLLGALVDAVDFIADRIPE